MPGTPSRPFILVLAGVNGAGKSSVGGDILTAAGVPWFNPDDLTRELVNQGMPLGEANAQAWEQGRQLLAAAMRSGTSHAFETTLGGNTIAAMLQEAGKTHDVRMIYVGLESPERHLARVAVRVASGGHDIPEQKIRTRWRSSHANLVALLPHLTSLQVFDNSEEVRQGEMLKAPRLLLYWERPQVVFPGAEDAAALLQTPPWAMPIVQAALELARR